MHRQGASLRVVLHAVQTTEGNDSRPVIAFNVLLIFSAAASARFREKQAQG